MQQYRTDLGGIDVVYDGHKNAYSPRPLPKANYSLEVVAGSTEARPDQAAMQTDQAEEAQPAEGGGKGRPQRKVFQVNLKQVEVVNLTNLTQFLEGKISWTPYEALHALEIALRHVPATLHVAVARSFYMDTRTKPISGGAEVWEGYFQALRPSLGRLLLNCDTAATAFYQPMNLAKFALEVIRPRGEISSLSQRDVSMLEHELRYVAIKTTHRGAVKRKYKIIGVTSGGADQITFDSPEGKVSVASYLSTRYKLRLRYPQFPCVQVAPVEKKIFLPLEVCEIVPGQRHARKLTEDQTADMIKIACQKPQDRCNRIREAIKHLKLDSNPVLDAFGIKIGSDLLQVNGRVLEAPSLYYGEGSRDKTVNPSFGAWNLIDKSFDTPMPIASWAVINFSHRTQPRQCETFADELSKVAQSLGMNVKGRNPPIVDGDEKSPERSIKQAIEAANRSFRAPPQILIVILPSTSAAFYGDIKLLCDTKYSIPSQCLQSKHLMNVKKPFCANLLMKINVKLGGTNWHLGKQMSFFTEKPTIVFGADVTHPGVGEMGKPSIAALVSNVDMKVSKYTSVVSVQESRMELIADLKNMVKAQLRSFYGATQRKPERILFYRDGVSEGQFAQLLKTEVDAIKTACNEIEAGYSPSLTYVVIQKRHHVRFFPADSHNADRSGNVPPGTVVDTGICHPVQFDFFLCSHSGIQGTSRPTHYHVLFDENKFSADGLQLLSYQMCYTFARCTRSVSFVPPAYYAHLLAFRARFHFVEESRDVRAYQPVKGAMEKTMYFI